MEVFSWHIYLWANMAPLTQERKNKVSLCYTQVCQVKKATPELSGGGETTCLHEHSTGEPVWVPAAKSQPSFSRQGSQPVKHRHLPSAAITDTLQPSVTHGFPCSFVDTLKCLSFRTRSRCLKTAHLMILAAIKIYKKLGWYEI